MSIRLPDLIVESIIRDGIQNIKNTPEILEDIFSDLVRPYASRKYGMLEIDKIKTLLTGSSAQEIAIVHSFHQVNASMPCFSIQLSSDAEDQRLARLDDLDDEIIEPLTDPSKLADLVRAGPFSFSYDQTTGKISVADEVDVANVFKNFLFVDSDDAEFEIKAIVDTVGSKGFYINKNETVDSSGLGLVKTFLDYEQLELRGVESNVQLIIGVHSGEPLLTKYLYAILKYILLSRKMDMLMRGIYIASFSGSDFARDMRYEGNLVYTRFLTLSGKVNDSWRSDQVDLIDSVIIEAIPCGNCGACEDCT